MKIKNQIFRSSPTLNTMFSHRSVRKFTSDIIEKEIVEQIIEAGISASTSNHLMSTSVIRITDKDIRQDIYEVSKQKYVIESPEFFIFCIDFSRLLKVHPDSEIDWAEMLLIGVHDVGIFSQNVLLAAESLGLGGVYIGSIRNNIEKIDQLLKLPNGVIPILGMCIGYPDQEPEFKPRFSVDVILSENYYRQITDEELDNFNNELSDYYKERANIDSNWTSKMRSSFNGPIRPHILSFLQSKGFIKK